MTEVLVSRPVRQDDLEVAARIDIGDEIGTHVALATSRSGTTFREGPLAQPRDERSPPRRRHRRRDRWSARWAVGAIIGAEVFGSLRLRNSVFQDEALYLWAGHQITGHVLHGTPLYGNFA